MEAIFIDEKMQKKHKMRNTWYTGCTNSKRPPATMVEQMKQQHNRQSTNGHSGLPVVQEGITEQYCAEGAEETRPKRENGR
jgi:hypothetical protein